ncbi:MAG: hypothetical protein KJ795_05270 [Gammaproteobacteria bacterium]|nr:hypothetical protein [Gammaproteobacteria bacterium]MBU1776558.1 hypothetical protein [Gammaproteobacteria bacterium]MBU1969437.1 hypothetical protein [Gammaproteobacteria bacterium]
MSLVIGIVFVSFCLIMVDLIGNMGEGAGDRAGKTNRLRHLWLKCSR